MSKDGLIIRQAVELLYDAASRLYPGLGAHDKVKRAIELLTGKRYKIKDITLNGELEEDGPLIEAPHE